MNNSRNGLAAFGDRSSACSFNQRRRKLVGNPLLKLFNTLAILKEQQRANDAGEEEDSASDQEGSNEMVEVEDMGKSMVCETRQNFILIGYKPNKESPEEEEEDDEVELHKDGTIDLESLTKPMVHPTMQKALSKQGYKLIGTHR